MLEAPDLFEGRVPEKFAGAAPHLVEDEEGIPFWAVEDGHIPIMIGNGSIGRPPSEWNNVPQRLEDFRPGVDDPAVRLADMDLNGVWASMCFPSLVFGFAGRVFAAFQDASAFRPPDLIGADRVIMESDYPHQDSTWPAPQTLLRSDLGHLDPESVRMVAYENATHLYRWPAPPAEWWQRRVIGAGRKDPL